ncbi:hypothetical protein E0H50_12545 [Kribbella sindirgiensis]|uniref:Uncharacterized protein n=1 Tax=Kribbella sindirgiensis TaxID=1124744 RepID=A0A4R0ITI8_9ACTN|nr:hypothetical protein E0H50_12545 [Kribbella sindirgiensis]
MSWPSRTPRGSSASGPAYVQFSRSVERYDGMLAPRSAYPAPTTIHQVPFSHQTKGSRNMIAGSDGSGTTWWGGPNDVPPSSDTAVSTDWYGRPSM